MMGMKEDLLINYTVKLLLLNFTQRRKAPRLMPVFKPQSIALQYSGTGPLRLSAFA
jgi:hypothetical protein